MIRVIGFDLDGTLYEDTLEIQGKKRKKIYEKISELFSIPPKRARELFEQFYIESLSGSKTIAKIADTCGKELGSRDIIQEALEEADVLDLITENKNLISMLSRLSQKRSLDLLTGSKRGYALRKLERLGISKNIFKYFLASEDGSKTTGEKYTNWIKRRNLDPGELLYVGDNEKQDIDVPKSFGIKTCFLGDYKNADYQIPNILDLEKLVEKF